MDYLREPVAGGDGVVCWTVTGRPRAVAGGTLTATGCGAGGGGLGVEGAWFPGRVRSSSCSITEARILSLKWNVPSGNSGGICQRTMVARELEVVVGDHLNHSRH